jgi:hypothetical protein
MVVYACERCTRCTTLRQKIFDKIRYLKELTNSRIRHFKECTFDRYENNVVLCRKGVEMCKKNT